MCMEDVRIGRKSRVTVRGVRTSGAGDTTIAPPNVRRIALSVSSDASAIAYIAARGTNVPGFTGIALTPETPFQSLTLDRVGSLLREEWVCSDPGALVELYVLDIELEDDPTWRP